MNLREAMDALRLTAPEVADALNTTAQHVRQMRMDSNKEGSRPAPAGWQKKIVSLARKRGIQMARVIDQLERESV